MCILRTLITTIVILSSSIFENKYTKMLNGRTNGNLRCAVRSLPPLSLFLRSCACLLLLGLLTYNSVEGQRSPCPDVFSYWMDNNTKQPFGYVKLQGLRANQAITLQIDMRIAAIVRKVSLQLQEPSNMKFKPPELVVHEPLAIVDPM